jgi:GNAT superfamily N-acetyltransferase
VLIKPLLIIPPSPARWHALEDLVGHKGPPWMEDIERRFLHGEGAEQDAFAVIADGGRFLAHACINRRHDVGLLGHVFTRPEHRGRGFARRLTTTLVSWFDMTGGKWLYAGAAAELSESLYGQLGFRTIRRLQRETGEAVTMLRAADGATGNPLDQATDDLAIRDVSRGDWPLIVALLQYRSGPDPRVSLDESAVTAESTGLELLGRQDKGTCKLRGVFRGTRLVALGSVATDELGDRTYAMLMPHGESPLPLRETIIELARSKGYSQVDFPMEALTKPQPVPSPGRPDQQAEGDPPQAERSL